MSVFEEVKRTVLMVEACRKYDSRSVDQTKKPVDGPAAESEAIYD